ncbi:MAG: sugar ABC transporter permease [bacterium]|nr:sugar ABC transporter permease [bacterium]MCY4257034.1 sugar ABC transporter permease [bacterium]
MQEAMEVSSAKGVSPPHLRHDGRRAATFIAPALTIYLLIIMAPTVATVWISFTEWRGIGDSPEFVGLDNYRHLFRSDTFWGSFNRTLGILAVGGLLVFFFSFLFTMLLREMRAKKFLRAVLFFPNVVPPVALAIAWGVLLAPRNGLLNGFLEAIGLDFATRTWLAPDIIFRSVIAGLVWIYTGFFVTILMAGVDRIPKHFYEAADLEGASSRQKLFRVTLPLTWDVLSVAAVLWVITAIKTFEFIYAFGGSGTDPSIATWTLPVQVYAVALGNRSPIFALGQGSAIAVVMVVLVGFLVVLIRRIMHRRVVEF